MPRGLMSALCLLVLLAVDTGCGFKETGAEEEGQDRDGAAGAAGSAAAEDKGGSAGGGDESGTGGESDGAPEAGAGGTGGTGDTGGAGGADTGGAAGSGGTGPNGGTLLACNPTLPPVTGCSGIPCTTLDETALATCDEICCTADGRCGTANTSQELARACTASLVQHPDCPAEEMLGQQVVGCCRPDGRCGVDATQIKPIAEGFGYPIDDCFAREDIPDFQPYLTPLNPIACTP